MQPAIRRLIYLTVAAVAIAAALHFAGVDIGGFLSSTLAIIATAFAAGYVCAMRRGRRRFHAANS